MKTDELLSQMTLEEKLAQLGSYWVTELLTDLEFDERKAEAKLGVGLGQITRLGGATNFKPQKSETSLRSGSEIHCFTEERESHPAPGE